MFFLVISFAAVAIPYGFERFYFKKSFGPFAILFWLLVFQWSVLYGGELILENEFGQSLPNWMKAIGSAIGGISYITIAMTPLVAVSAALIALIVILTQRRRKTSGKSSD